MSGIDAMVEHLLELNIVNKDGSITFTEESERLIHEIAGRCEEFYIVRESKELAEGYAKDLSAEMVYIDMLKKIIGAPTPLHIMAVVRLLIPVISQKLRERAANQADT